MDNNLNEKVNELINIENLILDEYKKMINSEIEGNKSENIDKSLEHLNLLFEVENSLLLYFNSNDRLKYLYDKLTDDNAIMTQNDFEYILDDMIMIPNKRILNKILPIIIKRNLEYFGKYSDSDDIDFVELMKQVNNQLIVRRNKIHSLMFNEIDIERCLVNKVFVDVTKKIYTQKIKDNENKEKYISFIYKMAYINPMLEQSLVENKFAFDKLAHFSVFDKTNALLFDSSRYDLEQYMQNIYLDNIESYTDLLFQSNLVDKTRNLDFYRDLILMIIESTAYDTSSNNLRQITNELKKDLKDMEPYYYDIYGNSINKVIGLYNKVLVNRRRN